MIEVAAFDRLKPRRSLTCLSWNQRDGTASNDITSSTLNLEQFSRELTNLLSTQVDNSDDSNEHLAAKHSDKVEALFSRLRLPKEGGWERYAFFDDKKNYTRNLVATDGKTFTLVLLCWSPGRESPIHDHPCDGCWLQILEGAIVESRYTKHIDSDELKCISSVQFHEGEMGYINDFMGYHKIGCASSSKPAVTLHLYCPPVQSCRIWLNPRKASKPSKSYVCMYSEYGTRVEN